MENRKNTCSEQSLLLDSRLILTTILENNTSRLCNVKLVDCDDYVQVYLYQKSKKITNLDTDDFNLAKIKINNMVEKKIKKEKSNKKETLKNNIDAKNIIRSKLECQRLAKSNIKVWKTFITLTFAENITDVKQANKKFRYFIDKVQRVKKDFKYICIPEFQKRGATHYHLLTNIDINDRQLIFNQDDNPKFKHIRYWSEGFTKVDVLHGNIKKIIGYISKYMTKDIDNRLFNKHRYFFSRNLSKPKVNFLNLDSELDNGFYIKKIQDKDLIYQNEYINSYDNNQVTFLEFVKK